MSFLYFMFFSQRNGHLMTDVVGREPITSICFSKDGQCVLVNSSGGSTIKLFDKSSGELLQEFHGHSHKGDYRIEAILDETDQNVLAGSEDGNVYVWSLVEATLLTKLNHIRTATENEDSRSNSRNLVIASLAFHPSASYLCSAAKGWVYHWGPEHDLDEELN